PPASVQPGTIPLTLPSNAIVALPLSIRRLDLPADRYVGTLYLTLDGATDRLRVPVDLSVRIGPLGPVLALLLGIVLGMLVRYMQGRGGKLAGTRDLLDRLRTRVTLLEDAEERAVLDKRLNLVEQDIDWGQVDRAAAALAEVERTVEGSLQASLDAQRPLAAKGESTKEFYSTRDSVPERAGELNRVAILSLLVGAWNSLATWFRERWRGFGVRATQALRPLLYVALLVGLAVVGLQTFYVENGATFGAQPLADYLSLVLWGLSADVTSRTLTSLGWSGPQPPPAGSPAGGGPLGGGTPNELGQSNHGVHEVLENVLESSPPPGPPPSLKLRPPRIWRLQDQTTSIMRSSLA
ncbi:MAG: hypothetical protein M3328_01600, partial [Chloroflexota bacterium]|nr:hypothetical protein [Chloroflexota bacterium]